MIDLTDHSAGAGIRIDVLTLHGPPPPLHMEFESGQFSEVFAALGLPTGRCFGSKSGYRRAHPRGIFMANANVFALRHGKIFWGDLDLAVDKPALERIARRIGCRLYVLFEDDGRFENANLPPSEITLRAKWCTGGSRRIPGFGRYRARARLTLRELATIADVPLSQLSRALKPEQFLELGRHLRYLEDYYVCLAANHGYRNWGLWWTMPHPDLAGKSPYDLLTAKSVEALAELRKKENQRWVDHTSLEADSTGATH